jgi:hypothetical protein
MPDRTCSSHQRRDARSNFLLWQIAYSEICDRMSVARLHPRNLLDAFDDYMKRERRGGGSCVSEPAVQPIVEPPLQPHARRGIVRRVLAGVVFVPLFVLVTRAGGYAFLGFVDLFIILGLFEFYRMMAVKGMHPYRGIGIASGLTLSTYMYFRSGMYGNFFLTFVLIAIMGLELTRKDNQRAVYHVATTVFGIVYVAYLGSHLVLLRELPWLIDRPRPGRALRVSPSR